MKNENAALTKMQPPVLIHMLPLKTESLKVHGRFNWQHVKRDVVWVKQLCSPPTPACSQPVAGTGTTAFSTAPGLAGSCPVTACPSQAAGRSPGCPLPASTPPQAVGGSSVWWCLPAGRMRAGRMRAAWAPRPAQLCPALGCRWDLCRPQRSLPGHSVLQGDAKQLNEPENLLCSIT